MSRLNIEPHRYDGQHVAQQIGPESLKYKGKDAWIVCELGEDDEFEIHFEAIDGVVESKTLDVARSLMRSIGELDNRVQESCAAECERTGLHSRNFDGMLAYVRVYANRAALHYFGTSVNTEWDEDVAFDGIEWRYLGVARPSASA